jgi:ADP-ribosylglycohydrolase
VPQGAILSPTFYNIFTSDVPSSEFCGTATFADDTAIFASSQSSLLVQDQLQDHLNEISDWKDWIGKLKSTRQKHKQSIFLHAPKTFLTLK